MIFSAHPSLAAVARFSFSSAAVRNKTESEESAQKAVNAREVLIFSAKTSPTKMDDWTVLILPASVFASFHHRSSVTLKVAC